MELRQLRYFVRIVELGSMSRAALDLDMVQSALSQQVSRLESELSTRLLQRTSRGVIPTEAGLAFFHEAQQARLSGAVSMGLSPTIANVLGLPLLRAMRERYPDVRLHMVSALSGHLTSLLNARQMDIAILFDTQSARRWRVTPLLEEQLFLIQSRQSPVAPKIRHGAPVSLAQLQQVSLILPSGSHGLRSSVMASFTSAGFQSQMAMEIDSLPLLMEAVDAGMGATVQPWSAVGMYRDAEARFQWSQIADDSVRRKAALCSLSDDELSPAALAARVVLVDCARRLVQSGQWLGASLAA
jgi:LysR family transcriptional regulator, regulatory protein for tcuABC